MPLNKFDTSVLNNPDDVSVKPEGVFNTSVLGTPDYEDMTPEFQAYAELQHEADLNKRSYFERVIDLGGHLISGAKRAPGDVIRGTAMNVKDFYKPENPDDLFYETQFSIMTPTERARVAQRANRNIELGMDPKTAKEDALNESLQEKHEHANVTADAMMKVADSKKFQPLPGYEHPETFMQGVAGALGQQIVRLPLMLFPATRPAAIPVMQMEIAGHTYQYLIEEGVEPDRAKVAANMSAMAQTPLEFLGDLVAVKAILGPRAWKNYVSGIARTMGTEGAEEFAQQYPDAMATLWAMNPDITLKDMWEEVSSLKTFREALYAGAIGAVTGGIVAGGGIGVREGWNKYVTKKQQTINDQRTGVLLGALTKMRLGEKLTDEENTALDQAMTSLPMDAVNRLRFQSPIESDGRTTVFEGMRQILPDPVQHEKVMAILDSIAHSYAEITGKDPEDFYEDELIGAEKTTLEEFQKSVELDMAAQGRTQFQSGEATPKPDGGIAEYNRRTYEAALEESVAKGSYQGDLWFHGSDKPAIDFKKEKGRYHGVIFLTKNLSVADQYSGRNPENVQSYRIKQDANMLDLGKRSDVDKVVDHLLKDKKFLDEKSEEIEYFGEDSYREKLSDLFYNQDLVEHTDFESKAMQRVARKLGYDGILSRQEAIILNPAKSLENTYHPNPSRPSEKGGSAWRTRFQAAAYHGSPHTFDKFSTSKIGTGEGAQAYGYGLYFAGKKEVADYYKKTLAKKTIDGLPLDVFLDTRPKLSTIYDALRMLKERNPNATIEDANKFYADQKPYRDTMSAIDALYTYETVENAKRMRPDIAYRIDELLEEGRLKVEKGHLYEVELAPEEDEYLLWDKPLSEQSEKVKAALEKVFLPDKEAVEYWRGRLQDDLAENGPMGYPKDRLDKVFDEALRDGGYGEQFGSNVWDELREAAPEVAEEAIQWLEKYGGNVAHDLTGEQAYRSLVSNLGSDQKASEKMHASGIRGIKYLDATSRGKGEGAYNYVIFSDEDVEIKARYQLVAKTPLGATTWTSQGEAIIHAFESANISTAIHEIGHVLLGLIEKYDPISYKAVSDWLKIPEERAARGLNAWTDTEHEKFAKGFEVYVMEGRAPTFRLQPVFRALKTMLLEIYRRIRKLDVQLNDDVRKVFDHWLSTEDERTADAIRDISNWFDVDQTPHPMGELSPDDYEDYDDIASKAREIVAAKVGDKRKRIMAQVRRQLYRMAKTQVEEMEYYQDLSYLMRCKGFNEQAVRESRNWSKDEMEYFKKKGVVRKNGHRKPDEFVHEQVYAYGRSSYDTGDGFLDMVLVMPPKTEAIQDLYNRFLSEYEESIEQEERNVNDMDAILEAEIDILNALIGRSPKRTKIALDRLGNVEALTDDDLRQLKKEYKDLDAVAREAYREGVRQTREESEQVLKDTKAAGKEEVKAAKGKAKEQAQALKEHQKERISEIRARNMEKILSIKEQQRERIAKLKEHAKIQKEKQKISRRMKRYLKSKHMLYEYRYQLQRFLAGYVKVKGFKEDPEQPALDTFLRNAVPIEIRDDDFISGLLDQVPSPWRGPDGNVLVPGRRSLDDLRSVALIADLIKGMDTLERENRKEEAIRFREQLAEGIYKAHGKEPSQYNVTGPLVADRPSWFDGAKDNIHQFSAELTKIEFLCNFLDGHELLGPMFNAVFKKVADAENAELVMSEDYFNNAAKILKGVIKDDAWFKRKYDIPGIPKQLTREQMFMIALNSGNQGNRKDLVEGNKIPDEAIDHIWDNMLTEQERNAVEKIWSLIDTLFPMLDNVNRKLMGMPLKKVEGHYFPIKHERKLSLFAARNEDVQNAKDAFVGPAYMAYPRAGHRDKRTGAVLPLRLDIGVIASHLEETIHDITHSIPVTEAYRVIIDPKVAKAITDIAGEQMYEQLVPWLKNISRPMREARSVVESLSLRMRKGTTATFLGLKATTTALQMLAGTQTIDEIGYAPVMKAVTKFAGNPVEMVKAINEKSVMMRYRGRMFDREIAQFHRTMAAKKVTRVMEKVSACYFTPIIVLDMAVAYPSWLAAYEKGFKDFQGDENKAVDYADSVVRRTQSAAGPKDLASIQRGNELKKWVTMFYTFFSVFQNRMMELNRKADMQGMLKPETLYMYFRSYMLQIAIPAVLSFMLYERRLPEGKEWFTEMLYYRLTGIPIIRDIANPVLNGWDYEFSPAAGGYAAFAKTFKDFSKTIEAWIEEDEIPWSRLGRDIVWTAGYWYGLPSAQMLITMDGIVDLWEDELESPLNLLFRQPRDMED